MSQAHNGAGAVSRRTLWTILLALLAGGIVVSIFAAESGIRFLQQRKYGASATAEQLYTVDRSIDLRVPISNLRSGSIETNSLGFRGPEIRVPKPQGTVRIAFLGASTTWCAEVSGNDMVWSHLVAEDLTQAFPGASVDYVNGGVPGYTAKSSLKNLEFRVAPLQPDIIVIYHATNDMSAELRRLAVEEGVMAQGPVDAPSWLAKQSLLWNLAEKNLRIWLAQRKVEANVGRLDVDAATLGESFRRDLTALVLAARQRAKVVAVATFSAHLRSDQTADQQLQAAASALYYMPFMTPKGLLGGYARYNDIIREVARATGAMLIEGEHDIPGDARHFADSVHFTDAGSRAMATRISRALAANRDVASMF